MVDIGARSTKVLTKDNITIIALSLELRAWTTTAVNRKGKLISALNFGIYDGLRENGIEIPFPQRDLHIRSGLIGVEMVEP